MTAHEATAQLSIPDVTGLDRVGAGIAYAEAGWYVVPAKAGTKNPGSVLGKGWDHQSTRDPATIAAWFAGTDHEICLHMGRSGALGIDIDDPEKAPEVLVAANKFRKPPVQQTRPETEPHRAHVIYTIPPGRRFGNGVGQLGQGWGEIRGDNGVLLVGPAADDRTWFRTGPVPCLPDDLAELLPEGSDSERAATDDEITRFLDAYEDGDKYELLEKLVDHFDRQVQAGESRHQTMVSLSAGAMKEARAGFYSAAAAAGTLESIFLDAVKVEGRGTKQGSARNGTAARSEWSGILSWAVGQANTADPEQTRARVRDHAEGPPEATELDAGLGADVEADFWAARPLLTHLHDFAQARRAHPWAVFGVALARILTATPHQVCLPPIIGGRGSLNTFIGLVGPSGGGKGIATAAAKDALRMDVKVARLASGEAIAHLYKRALSKKERADGVSEWHDDTHARLIDVSEIDRFSAQSGRQGSTLMADLRSAWSGELLGQIAADPSRSFLLEAHQYRLCLVAGIQPHRALILLEDEDGGTPQRFVWLPVMDRHMPEKRPRCPDPITWKPPPISDLVGYNGAPLDVAQVILDEIDAAHVARNRGDGDPLDGHRYQCQLKVAAGLGLADGRPNVSEEDWQLAGVVMRKSDSVRARVVEAVKTKEREANETAADVAARRAVRVEESTIDAAVKRVCKVLRRKLDRGDWTARSELRRAVAGRDRLHFEDALFRMVEAGEIEEEEGARGTRYRSVT